MRAEDPPEAAARSFDDWYTDAHPRIVRAVTVAIGDVEVAADATAEAFSKALERWSRVGAMTNPDGWTYRVALNDARRHLSRWRRPFRSTHRPGHAADPAELLADGELWDAVRSLQPRQREAVGLRYLAGLDEKGVAAAMGIPEGAASSALSTARARLREILGEDR